MKCFYYGELVDIFANEYTTLVFVFLISDYQQDAFQPGLLKTALYGISEQMIITDITHSIKLSNILEASFVAKQFTPVKGHKNILFVRVGAEKTTILYRHEETLYILPNNGLLTLLFPEFKASGILCTDTERVMEHVQKFIHGADILKSDSEAEIVKRYLKPLQTGGGLIQAECIFTDGTGNCYFAITEHQFKELTGDRPYSIRIQHYTGQRFNRIRNHISDVNPGEALFRFAKSGYLKLQINLGNASQLFRIRADTKIIIELQ